VTIAGPEEIKDIKAARELSEAAAAAANAQQQ
jgi:hypothetical protein